MAVDVNIVFPSDSTSNPGYNRFEPLVTPDALKKKFLAGVNFTLPDGSQLDEVNFIDSITDAISYVEHALHVTITPASFVEEHDYVHNDYMNFGFIQLFRKPIIGLPVLAAQYIKGQVLINFPNEWMRVYKPQGQIQITPTSGAIGQFNLNNSGFLPRIIGVFREYPQLFEVTYTAGFEQDKIPAVLNRLIGLKAAVPILNICGDLILGPGIASKNISMDGLSQSISAVSSGVNAGYAARIDKYQKEIDDTLEKLENYYRGINCLIS